MRNNYWMMAAAAMLSLAACNKEADVATTPAAQEETAGTTSKWIFKVAGYDTKTSYTEGDSYITFEAGDQMAMGFACWNEDSTPGGPAAGTAVYLSPQVPSSGDHLFSQYWSKFDYTTYEGKPAFTGQFGDYTAYGASSWTNKGYRIFGIFPAKAINSYTKTALGGATTPTTYTSLELTLANVQTPTLTGFDANQAAMHMKPINDFDPHNTVFDGEEGDGHDLPFFNEEPDFEVKFSHILGFAKFTFAEEGHGEEIVTSVKLNADGCSGVYYVDATKGTGNDAFYVAAPTVGTGTNLANNSITLNVPDGTKLSDYAAWFVVYPQTYADATVEVRTSESQFVYPLETLSINRSSITRKELTAGAYTDLNVVLTDKEMWEYNAAYTNDAAHTVDANTRFGQISSLNFVDYYYPSVTEGKKMRWYMAYDGLTYGNTDATNQYATTIGAKYDISTVAAAVTSTQINALTPYGKTYSAVYTAPATFYSEGKFAGVYSVDIRAGLWNAANTDATCDFTAYLLDGDTKTVIVEGALLKSEKSLSNSYGKTYNFHKEFTEPVKGQVFVEFNKNKADLTASNRPYIVNVSLNKTPAHLYVDADEISYKDSDAHTEDIYAYADGYSSVTLSAEDEDGNAITWISGVNQVEDRNIRLNVAANATDKKRTGYLVVKATDFNAAADAEPVVKKVKVTQLAAGAKMVEYAIRIVPELFPVYNEEAVTGAKSPTNTSVTTLSVANSAAAYAWRDASRFSGEVQVVPVSTDGTGKTLAPVTLKAQNVLSVIPTDGSQPYFYLATNTSYDGDSSTALTSTTLKYWTTTSTTTANMVYINSYQFAWIENTEALPGTITAIGYKTAYMATPADGTSNWNIFGYVPYLDFASDDALTKTEETYSNVKYGTTSITNKLNQWYDYSGIRWYNPVGENLAENKYTEFRTAEGMLADPALNFKKKDYSNCNWFKYWGFETPANARQTWYGEITIYFEVETGQYDDYGENGSGIH